MKPRNATILQAIWSFKSTAGIHKYHCSYRLLTGCLLFISLTSFAGEIRNNKGDLPFDSNYFSFLKTVFSPVTGPESIRSNLYLLNADSSTILADGVLTEYNNLYHDSVYIEDAYKFTNIKENLGITRYGYVLAVERRPVITLSDTVFFKLWKTTPRNYQFKFVTVNLNHPGMEGFLEDAYLATRTPIALNGTTKINFMIDANAASAEVNRFRIVYQTIVAPVTLPVIFSSVNGFRDHNKISINWRVESEINIEKYAIERSVSGDDFMELHSMAATGIHTKSGNYTWTDNDPLTENRFYRIRSVGRDGSEKYSLIIKVTRGNNNDGSVTIFPNPVRGNLINLRFINNAAGIYQVKLINHNGQRVYSERLTLNGGSTSKALFISKKLAVGMYQLEIIAPDNTVHLLKAIFQE